MKPTSGILRFFASHHRLSTTPNILRSGKYTRLGISKKRHNLAKYLPQHDLARPDILNPHLFYDKSVDDKLAKDTAKARKREEELFPLSDGSLESITNFLKDDQLIRAHPEKALLKIIQFQRKYPTDLKREEHLVRSALSLHIPHSHHLNIKNFGIFVTLCNRFGVLDRDSLPKFIESFRVYVAQETLFGIGVLGTEKRQKNFVHTLKTLLQKAKDTKQQELVQPLAESVKYFVDNSEKIQSLSCLVLLGHGLLPFSHLYQRDFERLLAVTRTRLEKEQDNKETGLSAKDLVSLNLMNSKAQKKAFPSDLLDKLASNLQRK